MNRNVEKYISPAMTQLKNEAILSTEFKGYLASLGPSIRMSGMIPAIAFYSSKEKSSKADRSKVLAWIFNILKEANKHPELSDHSDLLKLALDTRINSAKLKNDIQDISVALKLCIRTFSLIEN